MLIRSDIFSCQFLNLSIKLVWVIVFVGIWYLLILDHISFTNIYLCAFAYQSVYVCGSSLACIFGWLYSHLHSFVTRCVFSGNVSNF